jgi:hypothetical protein
MPKIYESPQARVAAYRARNKERIAERRKLKYDQNPEAEIARVRQRQIRAQTRKCAQDPQYAALVAKRQQRKELLKSMSPEQKALFYKEEKRLYNAQYRDRNKERLRKIRVESMAKKLAAMTPEERKSYHSSNYLASRERYRQYYWANRERIKQVTNTRRRLRRAEITLFVLDLSKLLKEGVLP